jgi:FkbM family methyltransferase
MLLRKISRVVEHPRVLIGKMRGVQQTFCFHCLTAEELLNGGAKTVIDVGANKGEFVDAAKFVFPGAKIYAFEPIPGLNEKLKRKGVEAFDFGLWDSEGEEKFYWRERADGASSFLKPLESKDLKRKERMDDIREIKVKRKRFDSLGLEIERPCYVKIDVEGAEDRVIRGFGDKLKEVDVLQIEWIFKEGYENQMEMNKIVKILEGYGFTGFIQKGVVYEKGGTPVQCDLLFFKGREED